MQTTFSEQRSWLGTRFFEVARRALRHDISEASEFFRIPQGQIAYVVGSIERGPLEALCKIGLPYEVVGQKARVEGDVEVRLNGMTLVDPGELEGWRREAFDLCVDHYWTVQGWARQDAGMAALMAGITNRGEVDAIANMHPRVLRKLAAATYGKIQIEQSMCMHMAMIFADAHASPDRVAIARSGCRISAAA